MLNLHQPDIASKSETPKPTSLRSRTKDGTAIIYCEGNFGAIDGKTANGLVRHSEKYEVLSVIDSQKAGLDSGIVLQNERNDIPIVRNLREAVAHSGASPDYFIFGMAPSSGMLSPEERAIVLEAIELEMNIVIGLHQFLSDDPEFSALSSLKNVKIIDVRKPREKVNLRQYSGRIKEVTCPRIAVLGTDCAIGKRTTAAILTQALQKCGLNAVMVGTGQTGLIQGARYGVALDAIPSQFCVGELEAVIVEAFEVEAPDVIIVEGQGALSHPAFSTSAFILRGSLANGVVLQHAPKRVNRCDFEQLKMPTPASEIRLIEAFADTTVIGMTINHENMTEVEITTAIETYTNELSIPVTDALARPHDTLLAMVYSAFPELDKALNAAA